MSGGYWLGVEQGVTVSIAGLSEGYKRIVLVLIAHLQHQHEALQK